MSAYNNIQNALNARLAGVPSIPTVAWPNVDYSPTQGTSFVRPTFLPAKSEMFTIGDVNKLQGIYQVDIFMQLKKGSAPLLLVADSIRDYFLSVNSLTSGSDTIHILEISISSPRRVESWWSCYVEINFMCFN